MRVFISHSSLDKPAVERLAQALAERGLEPWLDKWEIGPGDDIVARINAGLEEAGAGLIVFSKHSAASRWVEAETSYLIWARINEGKLLIPVVVDEDGPVPPLLRPLCRRGIDEIEAITAALLNRRPIRPTVQPAEAGRTETVLVSLRRAEGGGIEVTVRLGDRVQAEASLPGLPLAVTSGLTEFRRGFRVGTRRSAAAADRSFLESRMTALGRALGDLCLPGDAGEALAGLIDGGLRLGTMVEVFFETDDPAALGLPFEALRLPDGRLLAVQPGVIVLRRPLGLRAADFPPLAGPVKVLVAVGAPEESWTSAAVLDSEGELQTILDAVDRARNLENFEVRILEVGHPDQIAQAMLRDAYHVLHLSCHGAPGRLLLENEDGEEVSTTAEELLTPLRGTGRPLPLVFLNACHGGVEDQATASLAQDLIRAGVPAVLAMQASVSDGYATRLAGEFYLNLAEGEHLRPGRALALARRKLEALRQANVQAKRALDQTQPEYATAGLFVADQDRPLADYSQAKVPLKERPVLELGGMVPQLSLGELIGRRRELRQTLRVLRAGGREKAGVILTGIGGVGKSALAGRAMRRLVEDHYLVAAQVGRLNLNDLCLAVAEALAQTGRADLLHKAQALVRPDLDERLRLGLFGRLLAEEPLVLVLDDFEWNLVQGGGAFVDEITASLFQDLARACGRGRLLITSRHPVPGGEPRLQRVPVGPLSPAESRKLLLRLPALQSLEFDQAAALLRVIGGHPRILEFLDALQRGGQGRLGRVTERLDRLRAEAGLDPGQASGSLDESLQVAVLLGARDVCLEELLALAQAEGLAEALLQTAVSSLPVPSAGLARMLGREARPAGPAEAHATLARLADLSLVHLGPDGSAWVHRWTAEGLARRVDPAEHRRRHVRAGQYRQWRVNNETHDLADAAEAARNFLAGQAWDEAAEAALACCAALERFGQTRARVVLAAEIRANLPPVHQDYLAVVDVEGLGNLALGNILPALIIYQDLISNYDKYSCADSDIIRHQHHRAVLNERIGDIYQILGQCRMARKAFLKSLIIRKRLARAEPGHINYQRDLAISYNKLGDIYQIQGHAEWAEHAYHEALSIRERASQAEPDRFECQRDLAVSYNKLGDFYRAQGRLNNACEYYQKDVAICQQLSHEEPSWADFQCDLAVSYERLSDIALRQGQLEQAGDGYSKSFNIRERLSQVEPDRLDYQRDLAISYTKMGDLYWAKNQEERAIEVYSKALALRERLVEIMPYRTDWERDLSVSYNKIGDIFLAGNQNNKAVEVYFKALTIRERLAQGEPERADYQRDLAVTLFRASQVSSPAEARALLHRALAIIEGLKGQGRLSPADEPMIPSLRRMIQALG